MKKILILCATLIMLMVSVCSATPVRFFDGNVNDFVTLYNQMAQELNSHIKVDIKLYQSPFKNAAASYGNYTAYTCKVGNKDKKSPYITLFVDKSGYVSHFQVMGYIKDLEAEAYYEKIFSGSAVACVAMAGLEPFDYKDYIIDVFPYALQKETDEYSAWNQHKNRKIHIDTKRIGTLGKDKQYAVLFYATTD